MRTTPHPCLQVGAEPMIDGDIELKSVTFAYPARPGRLIFKEFNLRIPAGTSCALVGSFCSNKGKSLHSRGLCVHELQAAVGAATA